MREESVSVGHSRRHVLRSAALPALGLALSGGLSTASAVSMAPAGASGPFGSRDVLAPGSDNRLFVVDITDVRTHASGLRERDLTSQRHGISGNVHDLEGLA